MVEEREHTDMKAHSTHASVSHRLSSAGKTRFTFMLFVLQVLLTSIRTARNRESRCTNR